MRSALIGHTGFVGSNLASRAAFDEHYNTTNIASIGGEHFDLVVSAATRSDSHRINQNGAEDRAEVTSLVESLRRASINRLVLISTVCVYPGGTSPDEDTPLTEEGLTPYGRNRLHMETELAASFATTIVRLPQLYGDDLKKGIIYDLQNDYRVEHIDPTGRFQYYDVRRLWDDIGVLLDNGVESFNASSPPIPNATVAREVFGRDISGNGAKPGGFADMYTRDMRTKHAGLFNGQDGYMTDAQSELQSISEFVAHQSEKSDV